MRSTSLGTRTIGSPLAPVTIDQYTIDSRNNLRQNDDLHFYYAFQKDSRLESNAQGQTVPGFPDRRGGHRQIMTINETHIFSPALVNELRVGFNRISITFIPQTLVDTNALGINVGPDGDADCVAGDHDFRSGAGFRGTGRLPERP